MDQTDNRSWIAFVGTIRIAAGAPPDVARAAKRALDGGEEAAILVFDSDGRVVDLDFRGTEREVVDRVNVERSDGGSPTQADPSPYRESLTPRGRGRPKLGVVAREVTLLPRHWEWLAKQPGGASAAVRRLVDLARQTSVDKDRAREAKEVAYRFMSAMAGDAPGFEEATRALFAGNASRFAEMSDDWPADVREHARALAARAFGSSPAT
jgi:hypothetical protein